MDDWLNTYEVVIDEQEVTKLKHRAHQKMQMREDKFETSIFLFLLQITMREIRLFSAFAMVLTMISLICTRYDIEPYILVLFHSACLGAAVLIELFRMYRYRMSEIQYPTKIGMGRMFLYKMIALGIIEFTCMLILMSTVNAAFVVDGYVLAAYAILPNLLVCAGLLGISMFFHSLLMMLIVYGVSMLGITMIMNCLIERLEPSLLHSAVLGSLIVSLCIFLWMIKRLFTYMKEVGGQFVWN